MDAMNKSADLYVRVLQPMWFLLMYDEIML